MATNAALRDEYLNASRDAAAFAARCRELEGALSEAQRALATVINPATIKATSTVQAWEQCTVAEAKAFSGVNEALGIIATLERTVRDQAFIIEAQRALISKVGA